MMLWQIICSYTCMLFIILTLQCKVTYNWRKIGFILHMLLRLKDKVSFILLPVSDLDLETIMILVFPVFDWCRSKIYFPAEIYIDVSQLRITFDCHMNGHAFIFSLYISFILFIGYLIEWKSCLQNWHEAFMLASGASFTHLVCLRLGHV